MNQVVSNKIFAAVVAKLEAQKLEAEANLVGIIFNSVNVADHTDLVSEACEAVKMMAEAEDALASIQRNFPIKDINDKQ
tara:strand:- start:40 stop:276 length:237 start_codon:yes stop_codon:yes gene_type:complete